MTHALLADIEAFGSASEAMGNEARLLQGRALPFQDDLLLSVHPIVSVSLGLPATFQFGGARRSGPVTKYALRHGDVAVWGGPTRLSHHGVPSLKEGCRRKLGRARINLTFRRAL